MTRSPEKKLFLVAGYAGSGKTYVSRSLAKRLCCPLLDKDTLCSPFSRYLADTCESETYLEQVRPREYEVLYAAIEDNLAFNPFVVATAPFIAEVTDPSWKEFINQLAGKFEHQVVTIWVTASEETVRERIQSRGEERDAWKLRHWDKYREQNNGFAIPGSVDFVCVNEDRPLFFENRR